MAATYSLKEEGGEEQLSRKAILEQLRFKLHWGGQRWAEEKWLEAVKAGEADTTRKLVAKHIREFPTPEETMARYAD